MGRGANGSLGVGFNHSDFRGYRRSRSSSRPARVQALSRTHSYYSVLLDGQDLYAAAADVVALRRRVGMVFQKANPFPRSIFDNVAYGLRINGMTRSKTELAEKVE